MAEERDESIDLKAFEAVLASLTPRGDRLSRDRLMFLAGQASLSAAGASTGVPLLACKQCELPQHTASGEAVAHAQPGRWKQPGRSMQSGWAWPAAFGVSTAVAATLLVLLWQQPEPQVVQQIVEKTVYVPAPATMVSRDAGASSSADTESRGVAGGFSSRRKRFDRPAPGWWTVLTGSTDSQALPDLRDADTTYAALYARLQEGPSGLDLRDLPTGRGYRSPTATVSGADAEPSRPTSQLELRDELLRGGQGQSPAKPKSNNPSGERS
jgi:hypothetical protein